ncbi:MAG: hypothetical protein ACO0C9_01720 [Candidatus Methanosuratincola verstraetei]|jgi:membrane protease YdiL (CAAX protease family)
MANVKGILPVFRRFYFILAVFSLSTYLLSMALAIAFVCFPNAFPGSLNLDSIESYAIPGLVLDQGCMPLLFLLMILAFIFAFIVSGISPPNLYRSSVAFLKGEDSAYGMNFLLLMPLFCSASFFAFFVVHFLEESAGVPVGGVVFQDLFEELLLSSYSVFAEELVFRMLPVLVPVAFYLIVSTREEAMGIREALLALLKPKFFIISKRGRAGIPRRLVAALVVSSSLIFAYAHIASGAWGTGKFLTAFIAGLILGFTAFNYGFESSILIHWFYNAYWPSLALASEFPPPLGWLYSGIFYYTMISGALILAFLPSIFRPSGSSPGHLQTS